MHVPKLQSIKSGCFLLLLFYLSSSLAQTKSKIIGALPQLLQKAKSAKEKIDILNDYADTLCLHKVDTGRILAHTALRLSKAEAYHIGTGDASNSLGLIHFRRNNDSALFYFKQATNEYLKEYPGFEKYAFALNNISRTFYEQLKPDSSLHYGRLALVFINGRKEPLEIKSRWQMFSYGAIANAFSLQSRYDSANFYFLKAVAAAELLNNNKMLEVYFKGLSGIQAQLGNFDKAIAFGKKAIAYIENDDRALTIALASLGSHYLLVGDFVNAELMADSSLKVGIRCNSGNSIGRNYTTIGNIKMQEKQYRSALQYFNTGLDKAIANHNSKYSIGHLYHKTGDAYQALDSLSEAEHSYLKALETADGDNEMVYNIYYSLASLSEKRGEFSKANEYLKLHNRFHDSIYTNEKVKIISELNTRYETEKKDQQLQLFVKDKEINDALVYRQMQQIEYSLAEKRERELEILNYKLEGEQKEQVLRIKELDLENSIVKQQEQQTVLLNLNNKLKLEQQQKEMNIEIVKRQQIRFVLLLSGFAVLAILLWLLFNRYKLRKRIQEQANLNEQKQHISRDLHDEIGATLSGIAMYSHLIKHNLETGQFEVASQSADIIQNSASEMVTKLNDIIWLINPQQESLGAVIVKLEEYARSMCMAKSMKAEIEVSGTVTACKPPIETRKNIYLFCKEAINNAVKYSNSMQLLLKFELQGDALTIIIQDMGAGFDLAEVKRGNGLDNMQNRANELGAALLLKSKPGEGCSISLMLKITQ